MLIITQLAVVLLIGLVFTIFSEKVRMTNVLFLILVGMILRNIHVGGKPLVEFPPVFLSSIGILALVLIVFEGASEFKWKEFDTLSVKVIKLVIFFILFNLIFLSFFTYITFNIGSVAVCMIFSAIMGATAADVIITMFKGEDNRIVKILQLESLINTPFTVILPFIIIDVMMTTPGKLELSQVVMQLAPFLQQFVSGIGAGILIGVVVFRIMSRFYSPVLSPFALFVTAMLSYVLAENLGGNGVLAVTTLGLFFGSSTIFKKAEVQKYSSIFTMSLEILVFVLVGLVVKVPLNWVFYVKSLILFVLYIMIRYFTVILVFRKDLKLREIWFMTLNMPKGIAVATVIFSLAAFNIMGISKILDLTLFFMIYSVILSTVVSRFSKFFIRTAPHPAEVILKVEPKKPAKPVKTMKPVKSVKTLVSQKRSAR